MLVFNALLPLCLIVALSFLAARRALLPAAFWQGFARLTFSVLVPAFLLLGTLRLDLHLLGPYSLAYYGPVALLFLLLAVKVRAPGALAGSFSNTVLVGLPVIAALQGQAGVDVAIAIIAFHSLVLYSLFALVQGRGLKPLLATLKNPMIAALMTGLALNALGLKPPQALIKSLELLGNGAIGCALICLGAALASLPPFSRGQWGESLVLALAKLLGLPALVWLGTWLFGLGGREAQVLVLLAACPTAVNVLPFVKERPAATATIMLSTLATLATMPLWMALTQHYLAR
ncbi:AEC family transporter [Gallaecimonas kandeliae]|uniref:AEC family transporter n=1 Tax=Gallaecimonas kandeliae TaxID=3029055 RepID=UPI002647987B|nr:AEC family transporter [Gallaecimonas kandeliae]WKE65521.1 AEC family transporter [Gallaecimonas kandeliae]